MFPSITELKGRSLLTLEEFSTQEIQALIDLAETVKAEKKERRFQERLKHRNIALIFLKPSCRTRASFVVAAADEGAILQIFPAEDIRFGVKESTKDIARVIGRIFDGIALRADQAHIEEFARYSGVPVWNALSEDYHPTQILADLMTIQESVGQLPGANVAFVGDGRSNMVTSLAIAAQKMGLNLRVVSPKSRWPLQNKLKNFMFPPVCGSVLVTDSIDRGLEGADVVYGDIWVSMGQEQNTAALVQELGPYRITTATMQSTRNPNAIFLHCLPALHDDQTKFALQYPEVCDVSDEVFEGSQSRVFDQSENRMHTIKALMIATLGA
jgi:ornithine carbamoyltransferase